MIDQSGRILCTDSNPDFLGFFDPSIAPTLLYYAYIPVVLISLLLGFFILTSKNKNRLKARLFFALTVIFSLHIINELVQWVAVPAGVIYFGWSLSPLLKFSLLITTLYFVFAYTKERNLPNPILITIGVFFLPIIFFLPTSLNVSGFDIEWCGAIDGPLWSYLYAMQGLSVVGLLVWGVLEFSRFLKDRTIQRKQSVFLIFGTAIFLSIFFGSEFFGDITSIFEINLIGPIGMVIFLSVISYMIVEYKAFNTKLVGAQALVITLWVLIGSLLFVVKSPTSQVISVVTLIFTTISGFLLVKSVKREVEQRERIEKLAKDLEKTNTRLKELDKQKSEFVSIASHQLRSPLTAIRGYASMLVEGSFGKLPEKALESARRIEESAKLMAISIEDYLNVSRIESGNMKYSLSDFNLRDMVDNICDDLRPEAMKHNLILLFRSNITSRGVVHADVGKTSQIVHNLINNSLKYTPKGSISVLVRDDIKKKKIYVEIMDTGIGMSEKTLHTIFQKFERANNANSVNVSGTGLGLYVALKMAEAMGGTISAHSEGDGKGSTFTFELPLAM